MKCKMMGRAERTKVNIAVSVLYQIVAAAAGFVLPRFILEYYGSETNGMMQSIGQFLAYTSILECGIGGMVAASFYKPLAEGDTYAVSDIFNNTKRFFTRLSLIYCGFVVVFACLAGVIIKTEYDSLYVGMMVVILGISNFFSYYLAMTPRLLLRADQKLFIPQMFQMLALVLNSVAGVVMIVNGATVHMVKMVGALVFLITPVAMLIYVKRNYKISKSIFDPNREYPEKKDGIAHHISYFVHNNTDIAVLTVFCGVKEVSVYSVYNSVVVAVSNLMSAVANGVAAAVGNIIALDEKENLKKTFEIYNAVNLTMASFFCVCFAVLLVPFATVYTYGINDINYIRPIFAYLLVITQWICFLRIPYATTITSAGHYKQTKKGAIIEAVLNVSLSLVLVNFYGIIGVIIGTFVAMAYRTLDMVLYLSKNILQRSITKFLTEAVVNIAVCVALILMTNKFFTVSTESFMEFVIDAFVVALISFPIVAVVNLVINSEIRLALKNRLKK